MTGYTRTMFVALEVAAVAACITASAEPRFTLGIRPLCGGFIGGVPGGTETLRFVIWLRQEGVEEDQGVQGWTVNAVADGLVIKRIWHAYPNPLRECLTIPCCPVPHPENVVRCSDVLELVSRFGPLLGEGQFDLLVVEAEVTIPREGDAPGRLMFVDEPDQFGFNSNAVTFEGQMLGLGRGLNVEDCEFVRTASMLFVRGDASTDGLVRINDAVVILLSAVRGRSIECEDAGDANDSGRVDISDAVFLLRYLFQGGHLPPAPGPLSCGPDESADGLGCGSYPACRTR